MSHQGRKSFRVPRGVHYLACGTVHVAVGGAGYETLPSGPLGGEDEVVQLDLPVRRGRTDDEGTADLAPVAAVRRTEADGQKVTLLDPPVGGAVAASAGVRTGTDGGRERGTVGTVVDQATLQFQGQVTFGTADEDGLEQFTEGLVGDFGADPEAGDLLLVLHHPQLLDRAAQIREAQPGHDRADGAVPGDGQVMLLHREGLTALPCREVGGGDGRVATGSGQPLHAQRLVGPAFGRAVVRWAEAQQQVLGPAEQQDGAVRGGAREIADVGGAGHQRGGAAAGLAAFP